MTTQTYDTNFLPHLLSTPNSGIIPSDTHSSNPKPEDKDT